ncbi:hypothetical protein EHW99_1602 [Erwinia amylovora]|uniref:Uncharacterized protein n=3 Tax=Erwinia amylovora TaxID=552 RepID=A0A831EQX4_ERWAM|nr:hypothetical protein EaACW_1994 [Erwinia amylovora ACW56400]QJQ54306.1 hypothetical protein EHX00_1602 [Erwinia amylovora]CBA20933.1 hypothetical protein predicted by Glimmer/Critica [Erwinia amylovora CFBP1430]CBJ46612.1 hypothetical protein EAM_1937 [Erwinia amylovora ATCC 49946]CBX80857.1 hypothetical protein predicted by Glimmer/Critica [Erwinia amylovora ATCC BAA-2158]CCO78841.1 hypothetical protein BN432_2044 [Erwinia amylovora Ea356]CCO82639.1 hypothetical protein BN433_2069 [Erwini
MTVEFPKIFAKINPDKWFLVEKLSLSYIIHCYFNKLFMFRL